MSLKEFKRLHNISTIVPYKGQGRAFATVIVLGKEEKIFFAEGSDLAQPLFVQRGAHDAYWATNKEGAKELAAL